MKNIKSIIKSLSIITLMIVTILLTSCDNNPILKEIKIDGEPVTTFYIGEEFTVGDITVSAVYSNNKIEVITDYNIDSSKVDNTKEGSYQITITYENIFTTYTINYVNDPITELELKNPKTKFEIGEEFTVGDLEVIGKRAIRGDITITNYDVDSSKVQKDTKGNYEITIKYENLIKTYEVEYKTEVDGFELVLNDLKDSYTVNAIEGYDYANYVTIPSEYNNLPITVIGDMKQLKATYVKIPASVTLVKEEAFMGNKYIALVDFTGCSCAIESAAFYGTDLYAVELGNVTEIGEEAFADSSLMTLSIPATVTEIGDGAFNATTLHEVSFLGDTLPTLGNNVFGEKFTEDDYLYIYAKEAVWAKLFENVTTDDEKAETVINHFGVTYGAYLTLTAEQIEYTGMYTGDAIIYQIAGDVAVVIIDDYATAVYTYSYKGISFTDEEYSSDKQVIALDSKDKKAIKVTANSKGEYIYNTVLYEYVGTSVVYMVSEEVTEVIGGVGMNAGNVDTNTRFIIFGDNVTTVGAYAFAFGQLFGVTFSENITSIGEMAFFGQSYLQEIVFKGKVPPTIGQAAFCYIGQIGLVPTPIMGAFAAYGLECKVYIPSPASWFDEGYKSAYITAFNESLIDLDESLVKDENGNVILYSSDEFSTLSSYSDLYKFENTFTFEYGTIYMTAVNNGYIYVDLNEKDYDGKGSYQGLAYAKITDIPGYSGSTSPKKIEILFKTENDEAMRSFSVYGKFDLTEKTYTFRGIEAGTYGSYPTEILELDGYGKITYYHSEKGQYSGTYTVDGNIITVNNINIISTLTYDSENNVIKNETATLNTLGEEAGVYFDVANAAKIELDGTPYELNNNRYSGKLKLTYKGTVYESGYVLDGTKLTFTLNDVKKEFTYSKQNDAIVSGYFDSNWSINLNFKVVSSTGVSTYTNGTDTLVLDGYYNATLNDKTYLYMQATGTDVVILYNDEETIFITLANDTYTLNRGTELGMYYVGSDINYRMYLAGNGVLVYKDGGAKVGEYTYNEETGEIIITKWNGENNTSAAGVLKDGFGYMVYDYLGDTYIYISKEPFEKASAYLYTYTLKDDETISNSSEYITIYVSNNKMLVTKYGALPQIVSIENMVEGEQFKVTLTNITTNPIEVGITLSHKDNSLVLNITGPYETTTFMVNETEYILEWIDENHEYVSFYKNESYPSFVVSKVNWNETKTGFSFGKGLEMSSGEFSAVQINNYGTENVEAIIQVSSPIYYDSSSKAEYSYYRINVYSDTELWVSNSNIAGGTPEVCTYTTEVKDGVTYYTFYSTATQKTVTFIIKEGIWSSSFSVVEEK